MSAPSTSLPTGPAPVLRCPGGCGRPVEPVIAACGRCLERVPFYLRRAIASAHDRDPAAYDAATTAAADWLRAHIGVRT